MLASLAKSIGISVGTTDDENESIENNESNEIVTTGIKVEVWVELGETLTTLVTRFAAKMVSPHACGQWLVCDWETHEKSNNLNFKGFQKIYRKMYKPTKMKQQCQVILNSDNNTDSDAAVWGHVTKVLNEFANSDVFIERSEKKSLRGKKH